MYTFSAIHQITPLSNHRNGWPTYSKRKRVLYWSIYILQSTLLVYAVHSPVDLIGEGSMGPGEGAQVYIRPKQECHAIQVLQRKENPAN